MNRRQFLQGILASGASPILFNGCATGFLANRKVNVAIIGCGRISSEFEMPCVFARPELARIVAVCDLDRKRAYYAKYASSMRITTVLESMSTPTTRRSVRARISTP